MLWDSVKKDLGKEDVNSTEWEKIVEHQETRRQVVEKAEKNYWRGPRIARASGEEERRVFMHITCAGV